MDEGRRCRTRWARTEGAAWQHAYVSVGTQPGGWWVMIVKQVHVPVEEHDSEAAAYESARQWMDRIGGEWHEVPCYPTEEAKKAQRAQRAGDGDGDA